VPGHFLAGRAVVSPRGVPPGDDQAGNGRPGPRVPHGVTVSGGRV